MDLVLRPMSISQVLDRTFYLYRNNFVLFAGIAIITPALMLIAMLVQLKIFGPLVMPQQPEAMTPQFFQAFFVRIVVALVVASVIRLFGTALASSATAYAVSMVHLGKSTTIAGAYRQVRPIFWRILWLLVRVLLYTVGPFFACYALFIGLAVAMVSLSRGGGSPGSVMVVVLGLLIFGLVAIVGAVVWSLYAVCRYALAVPACTLENLPAGQALRRSRFLTNGTKWGILGIIFLTGVMSVIVTYALQLPALLASNAFVVTAKTQISIAATVWIYVAEFLGGTVAGPVATIALALVYYDQRVRKEAFDLQMMMDAMGQQVQTQPAVAPPPMIG